MLPTPISGPPEFGFTFDELRLFERIAELGSLAAAARGSRPRGPRSVGPSPAETPTGASSGAST